MILFTSVEFEAQEKSVRNAKNNGDSGGGVGGIQQKNKYNDERGEKRNQVQIAVEIQPEYSLIVHLQGAIIELQ